jgi:hypothetical protein
MKIKSNMVWIKFWDHAHWSGAEAAPIECEICGVIVAENDVSYIVAVWICGQSIDDNAEQFAIVKGAIIEMRRLEVGKILEVTSDSKGTISTNSQKNKHPRRAAKAPSRRHSSARK